MKSDARSEALSDKQILDQVEALLETDSPSIRIMQGNQPGMIEIEDMAEPIFGRGASLREALVMFLDGARESAAKWKRREEERAK